MQAKLSSLFRRTGLLAGATIVFAGARAAVPTDAFPDFDSYVKISGQAASITGDASAFQKETGLPENGGLGIEDLHISKDFDKDKTIVVDGHALSGSEDYLAKINVAKNDFGSFEVGYKRFRTFYDGVGGFFPLSDTWMPLNPENLHVDRGEFWAQATLTPAKGPAVTIRYSNATRTGQKDSLIWGDTDFTGLPNNNPPYSQTRKILPSYLDLDEHHQTLEATLKQTVGKTSYEVSLVGDKVGNLDTRYGSRYLGEAKPYPTPASTVLLPAAQMNNQITYDQASGQDTKMFGANAKTDTAFSDKFSLETGLNYQLLTGDFNGDRPLWTTTPTKVGNIVVPSNNNLNLLGSSKVKIYSGLIGLTFKPVKDLSLKASVKGEDNTTLSAGTLTSVAASANTTTGVITTTSTNQVEYSNIKEDSLTPSLDINYSGIRNISLFASGSSRLSHDTNNYAAPYTAGSTPAASSLSFLSGTEDHANYTTGASWRPSLALTVRGEVFYKDHTTNNIGYGTDLGNYYGLNTKFTGGKITLTTRVSSQLTLTTRFIYQKGTAQVTGPTTAGTAYDSTNARNQMLCETIDWTPNAQFYVQASATLVRNVIDTIYPNAGTAPAAGTTPAWDVNAVLQNSNNNYATLSLVAGAVVTKTDDLQFRVIYYKADDGDAALATVTQPFGVATENYSATVGVKHKFSARMMGDVRVGYFNTQNDTTGGNTNYKGPLAYISLDYAL